MKKILAAFSLLIVSCASQQPVATNPKNWDLNLVVASQRNLNLEPCGCSFYPLGGMAREWEYLKRMRESHGQVVHLNAGSTFSYPVDGRQTSDKASKAKSEAMVEALNSLNTNALSLTEKDLYLGLPYLQTLQSKANFPFIATNYKLAHGQTWWKSHYEIKSEKADLIVLSLADKPKNVGNLRWEDPLKAANRELSSLPPHPKRLVVALSSLPEKEEQRLKKELPGVHLWVRSRQDASEILYQSGKNLLEASPHNMGRKVLHASFQFPEKYEGFFSPAVGEILIKSYPLDMRRLNEIQDKPGMEKEKALLKNNIAVAKDVPWIASPELAVYEGGLQALDKSFDVENPLNPVEAILDRYHNKVRDIALSPRDN